MHVCRGGNGFSFTHDTFKVLMGPLNENFPLLIEYVKVKQMGDPVQICR